MAEIIDLNKVAQNKKEKERWARIKELIDKNRAQVEENPWPLIEQLQNDIINLYIIIMEIDSIVYPKITHLESEFPEYTDLRHEAMTMVAQIRGVLLHLKK